MKRVFLIIFLFLLFIVNLAIYLQVPVPLGSVIVTLNSQGGIGNQLFRYAAGYALAKKTNSRLYVIVKRGEGEENLKHPFDGDVAIAQFRVDPNSFQYKNKLNKAFAVKERVKEDNFFDLANKPNRKVLIIDDDFESDIFFKEYKSEILNIFTPRNDLQSLGLLLEELAEEASVCVHVRRGDMMQKGMTHYKIDIEYQKMAMKLARDKIIHPRFYIFSDSITHVKEELKDEENLTFINKGSFEDFILMSRCANNIIANSTYSWWAAYLNELENHLVFAPYPRYSSEFFVHINKDKEWKKRKVDFYQKYAYPDDWIKVDYEKQ